MKSLKNCLNAVFVFILILLSPPLHGAQNTLNKSTPFCFDNISLEEGLSNLTVYCILQDSYGFMWFGTEEGLNKFNGYDFTNYVHNTSDPNSISHNFITALHEDSEGYLWVGTFGGGLNKFDRKKRIFKHYIEKQATYHPDLMDMIG